MYWRIDGRLQSQFSFGPPLVTQTPQRSHCQTRHRRAPRVAAYLLPLGRPRFTFPAPAWEARWLSQQGLRDTLAPAIGLLAHQNVVKTITFAFGLMIDRKSTRLNSSHLGISHVA